LDIESFPISLLYREEGIDMRGPFSSENTVSVLAIGHSVEFEKSLLDIFSHSKWKIHFAGSIRESRRLLIEEQISVVLCEHTLTDGKWVNVLHEIEMSGQNPRLIVASASADDAMWAEVLNLGGYDVLEMPFQHQEVTRVLSLAWLHWRKQPVMQTRALAAMAAG
jgi:DNA-binding NtrC family response regulator